MMRVFDDNVYVQKVNDFNTAIADATYYPASGSFIDVSEYERFVFLILVGTLDTAITFTVRQDTAATATAGVKAVTGAAVTIAADDDNQWVSIEVETARLDIANGFHYVSLYGTDAAGGNDYAAIVFLGIRPRHLPVTQPDNYSQAVVVAG